MSSIVTSVLNVCLGLLVSKLRDGVAGKLKDGDITDQQFRNLIVREMNDIKTKLDGISRKDLVASLNFMEEGLALLYQFVNKVADNDTKSKTVCDTNESTDTARDSERVRVRPEVGDLNLASTGSVVPIIADDVRNLELSDLDDSTLQCLSDAKSRFKAAREDATRAFSNEALSSADRILAMKVRISAIILEGVDRPLDVIGACKICLEQLHAMATVRQTFTVHFTRGLKSYFNTEQRTLMIASVCLINQAVFDLIMMFGAIKELAAWPRIDIGCDQERIHPVVGSRARQELKKVKWSYRDWTFGHEGQHRLESPADVVTDSHGRFIVADISSHCGADTVKVFSGRGEFLHAFRPLDSHRLRFLPWRIATDSEDNVYVLAEFRHESARLAEQKEMYVFDKHGSLKHKFSLRDGFEGLAVAVSDAGHVIALVRSCDLNAEQVHVYEDEGQFRLSFGTFRGATHVSCATEKRVLVLSSMENLVYIFSEDGQPLHKLKLKGKTDTVGHLDPPSHGIALNKVTEHIVVVSRNRSTLQGQLEIYSSRNYSLTHVIPLRTERRPHLDSVDVSIDGSIAVADWKRGAVHVV